MRPAPPVEVDSAASTEFTVLLLGFFFHFKLISDLFLTENVTKMPLSLHAAVKTLQKNGFVRRHVSHLQTYTTTETDVCVPGGELTVSLAGCRAIVGTEARLHLPASDLQLVGIGQMRPAHVAHPLLLTSSALSYVDGHPGRPRRVPLHLRTRLQVTGFVFLQRKKKRRQ